MMDIDKMNDDLLHDEGFVSHAYGDSLGYLTIGIGRLIDKRRNGGITLDEAKYLLNNDIHRVIDQLDSALPWFKNLSDAHQRALCNVAFQLGINGLLGFKETLKLMGQRRFEEAADQALKSKWAKQTPERAKRVCEMIRTGR